jgi:hypothetical protein
MGKSKLLEAGGATCCVLLLALCDQATKMPDASTAHCAEQSVFVADCLTCVRSIWPNAAKVAADA